MSKRGTASIFGAKLAFLASGYVGVAALSRFLTPEEFGDYNVVMGVVALINMVLIHGTMQTVSRFVAQNPARADGLRRRAFAYQALFAGVVIGGVLLLAPTISGLLNDDGLTPLIRLGMAITGVYAFYAINVGVLNGEKRFLRQASLDVFFSTVKWSAMVVLAFLGYQVAGVIVGFALAAVAVFILSFVLVGRGLRGAAPNVPITRFVGFAFSVMGVALLINGLLQADLLALKRLSPVEVADLRAGLYGAAQQIARVPYYLMVAASLVIFPAMAALKSDDQAQRQARADTASQAWTGLSGIVLGMAAVTAPIAGRVVLVLFPERYGPVGDALSVLILGLVLLTMLNISVTMISGSGRPEVSALIVAVTLITQVSAAALLVEEHGLVGAAASTLIAAGFGVTLATGWCRWSLGLRIAIRVPVVVTLGCTLVAGAGVWLASNVESGPSLLDKLITLAWCGLMYCLYLLILLVGGVLLGARADESRVLLVTKPLAPPYNDGAKVMARALALGLPRNRVAVLTTKREAAAWREQGFQAHGVYGAAETFGPRTVENLRVLLYLLACRFHYSTLHFFFAPAPRTAMVLRMLRRLTPGVRFVQTVLSRPADWSRGRALIFGDLVTVGSQASADALAAYGVKAQVVRPGIDALGPLPSRTEALAKLKLDPEETHILFAGDVDDDALAHLATLIPQVLKQAARTRFHLSVRTKNPDAERRARALCDEVDVDARVSIWVDHAPFDTLLDAQDLMCFPQDALHKKVDAPLVVLETLARGKPVFILDRDTIRELVPSALHSEVMSQDASEMAEQIARWSRRESTIDAAELSAWVEGRFSITRMAREYGELHG